MTSIIKRETEIENDLNNQIREFSELFKNIDNPISSGQHCILFSDYFSSRVDDFLIKNNILPSLILTSPPYNAGHDYGNDYNDKKPIGEYIEFLRKFIEKADKLLIPGGRLVINIRDVSIDKGSRLPIIVPLYSKACLELNYKYRGLHIWYKGREESSTAWGSWLKSTNPSIIDLFEYVFVFQKPGEHDKKEDNITKEEFIESVLGVWKIRPVKKIFAKRKNNLLHPCPFPIELAMRVIKLYSFIDDWIIDPFGGIGSSSIAAMLAGRNSVSIDLNIKYCQKAYERLKEVNPDVNAAFYDQL